MAETWHQVDREGHVSREANEGLATWVRSGHPVLIYRGSASVPKEFIEAKTWVHIGDPDAHGDLLVASCYRSRWSVPSTVTTSTDG